MIEAVDAGDLRLRRLRGGSQILADLPHVAAEDFGVDLGQRRGVRAGLVDADQTGHGARTPFSGISP